LETIKYLRVSATAKCNAHCWYCFNESQPFDCSVLENVEGFDWLIQQLVADYGTQVVRFTGGEPLLNPHLIKLIKISEKTGIQKIGLTTNGDLLPEKEAALADCRIDEYAIHLRELDANSSPVNINRIKGTMGMLKRKINNLKFNIVLTQKNKAYVEKIIKYTTINGGNLLILDLLQAGNIDADFEANFASLNEIRAVLLKQGFSETVENDNSKVYKNSVASIKLLEHYADYTKRTSYCTQSLEYHPVLLTPDFSLSVCTHFGQYSIPIVEIVKKRDETLLRNAIIELKSYLKKCSDCSSRVILKDANSGDFDRFAKGSSL